MGTRSVQQTTPDLFSTTANREDASPPSNQTSNSPAALADNHLSRHVLPKDLPNAIKQLSDKALDELSAAVSAEQQRRGRNPPSNENAQLQRVEEASVPMSVGKINAVRAAFKVGLKPSQIARQFRIS
jgi:hypothetical protein